MREGAVAEVRLYPDDRGQRVPERQHDDDRTLASLALDGEQQTHARDHQTEIGATGHHQHREDREPPPTVRLGKVERAQQRRHRDHLGVEPVEVQVVHHRIDRVDEHQRGDGPDAQVGQAAADPPQRHDRERQGRRLQHQEARDDRQHEVDTGHRVERERRLLCHEVPGCVAERDVGRQTLADEPRRLGVDRQVLRSVERPGPRQGERGQQDEQRQRHDPRQRSVRPLAVESRLPAKEEIVEPPPEGGRQRFEPSSFGCPSTLDFRASPGSMASIRCGPLLRALLTSVLTG